MSDGTTNGSPLPTLSAADEAAFQQMQQQELADVKAGTHPMQQLTPPNAQPPAAPAPAAAPSAPAATPQIDPEARVADDGKHYVPVETLITTRQTLKGQLADTKAVLDATQQQLQSAMALLAKQGGAQAQQPAAAEPAKNPYDKNLNPIEHMQFELEQANARLEAVTSQLSARNQQEVAAQQLQQQQQVYVQHHNKFAQVNPGYQDAYKFLVDRLVGVHKAQGYDDTAAQQLALQVEWSTVTQAVNRNQDPCAVLWNMAKELGFQPQTPAAPGAQPGQSPLKAIKLAQDAASAATSLSGVPGSPGTSVDMAALATMDKKEFDAFFANDPSGKKWEKMMLSA